MADELKVGIFGAGSMGRVHAQALQQIDGVRITAVASRQRSSTDKLIGELELDARACDSFSDVLDSGCDAVYINLIPSAHNGECELAASRGVHVFLEKPIAACLERARSMADAVQQAGIISQVGYHYRFGHAVEQLRQKIDSGVAGRVTLFQGRFFAHCLHAEWWRKKEHSVAQVFEQVIHTYDMAQYLIGDEMVHACGSMANLCHRDVADYTIEDTSASVLQFKSGAIASIAGSNCAVPGLWTNDFRVVCEKLTADFSGPNAATFYYPTGEYEHESEHVESDDDMYLKQSQDFIAAIRAGRPARSPISEGLKGVEICSAVIESAASKSN